MPHLPVFRPLPKSSNSLKTWKQTQMHDISYWLSILIISCQKWYKQEALHCTVDSLFSSSAPSCGKDQTCLKRSPEVQHSIQEVRLSTHALKAAVQSQ